MDAFWKVLGTAPTPDSVAIKRAYAKRLKVTRPDDDADAYQLLREAYDWALEWARWQRAQIEEIGPTEPFDDEPPAAQAAQTASLALLPANVEVLHAGADHDALSGTDTSPADDGFCVATADGASHAGDISSGADATPAHHRVAPDEIAHAVEHAHATYGDAALLDLWPRVRDDLDGVPLAHRAFVSSALAALVLRRPRLPQVFVQHLGEYFGWGQDFRSARDLGTERDHALSALLRDRGLLPSNDPNVLRRFADVRTLHILREERRWLRAVLFALLLPPRTLERWRSAPPGLRGALGMNTWAISSVQRWLVAATVARAFLFAMLLALVFAQAANANVPQAIANGIASVMVASLIWGASLFLTHNLHGYHLAFAQKWQWMTKASPARTYVGMALALLAAALVLPNLAHETWPYQVIGWGIALLLSVLVAWSPTLRSRGMLVPAAVAMYVILLYALPDNVPALAPLGLAVAWALAGQAILLRAFDATLRVYRNPFSAYAPSNGWAWIWFVVVFKVVLVAIGITLVIAMPLTLLVQGLGYGQRFVFGTLAMGFAVTLALGGTDTGPWTPMLGLLLGIVVMASLQGLANAVSRLGVFRRSA